MRAALAIILIVTAACGSKTEQASVPPTDTSASAPQAPAQQLPPAVPAPAAAIEAFDPGADWTPIAPEG